MSSLCGGEAFTPFSNVFLINDNLSIHRNKDIVAEAEDNGIHMINIMPESSH